MQAEDREWDETKASENYAKYGVSFETARAVFKDAFAVEELDDREDYGEERFTIVGMVADALLFVAYTLSRDSSPADLSKKSNQT